MRDEHARSLCFLLIVAAGLLMSVPAYTAQSYIRDVLSGRQVVCKLTRLAVERHVADLKRVQAKDPTFPYYFDAAHAKRVIDFKQQLRHTKGEWADPRKHDTRIHLEPWQQFIDWVLFGWRRADGYRRFSKAYIEVARKNGKTTNAAATALYCFAVDRPKEAGPEVYCVATKRDQARISWDEAQRQIDRDPFLKAKVRTYKQTSTLVIPGTASRMRPLGQDSDTEDGLNPHFALVDEYHAHPDNSMLEVMASGMGARKQPMTYIITTAGFDKNCACYQEERELAVQILEHTIEPVPESYFAVIYTLDPEDDWTVEANWVKANPNLGVSVNFEYLRERVDLALETPAKANQIKTKNFNIWTQSVTRWILDERWMACKAPVDESALEGLTCYGGLDLSASVDITAYTLCFAPDDDGPYQLLWRFFMPEDNIIERERSDKVPYTYWADQGLIYLTPGNVVDYDFIEQEIDKDLKRFKIAEFAYDPWKAHEIVNHLTEARVTMVPIHQRFTGMAQGTDIFEKYVLGGRIAHGGNPVARWMLSCTEVKSDRQGNIMPMKPERDKSGKRIDGIVSAIMAVDRAARHEESVYESRGIRSV